MISSMNNIINNILTLWPCHRMPERSLCIGEWRMPVCSRCFGIVIGLPLGMSIGLLGVLPSRWLGGVFLIPLIIDAGTQHIGYRVSNNFLRIVTGILCGMGIGAFLLMWLLRDIKLFSRM